MNTAAREREAQFEAWIERRVKALRARLADTLIVTEDFRGSRPDGGAFSACKGETISRRAPSAERYAQFLRPLSEQEIEDIVKSDVRTWRDSAR